MAADIANQKVFVPLAGVLKVQDELRRFELMIADPQYTADQKALWRNHVAGLKTVIQALGLPIDWKDKWQSR